MADSGFGEPDVPAEHTWAEIGSLSPAGARHCGL